jgi:hypothetical protein
VEGWDDGCVVGRRVAIALSTVANELWSCRFVEFAWPAMRTQV